jgi:sugar phosphate isomerase/epimerase
MRFGYGTNGFANHRLDDALAVIADLGYEGVALTLDHHHLDPFGSSASDVSALRRRLDALGLSVVIETGARYLLDPWRKHAPTLLDEDPALRLDFLRRAVSIGRDLGAEAVSFWAGICPPGLPRDVAWDRLVAGCSSIVDSAASAGVTLGFEPEPGMLVQNLDDWFALREALGAPSCFGLTLDIGHCQCLEPVPVPACVERAGPYLVNVQIDDMVRGVHEHLEFGTGEIDFPPVLRALTDTGYTGLVAVELPRHSHAAPTVARSSLAFLRRASLLGAVSDPAWLSAALERVGADPGVIGSLFPAVSRRCGRSEFVGWHLGQTSKAAISSSSTVDDVVRAELLAALPLRGKELADEVNALYRYGDAAEKRAVLRALHQLDVGDGCVDLVRDAIRTNDPRLVAAALGPYARHLDDAYWRQAVLKCVFMEIPLSTVDGLAERADAELGRMLAGLAEERTAAGRTMPADALALLEAV